MFNSGLQARHSRPAKSTDPFEMVRQIICECRGLQRAFRGSTDDPLYQAKLQMLKDQLQAAIRVLGVQLEAGIVQVEAETAWQLDEYLLDLVDRIDAAGRSHLKGDGSALDQMKAEHLTRRIARTFSFGAQR